MKQQILILHGGTVFDSYDEYLNYLRHYKITSLEDLRYEDWKSNLEDELGEEFEVIRPSMPCKRNAKYIEWQIWLEKFLPFLRDDIILIGHSLGGTFWLKYLAENDFPVKISQLHLVAAVISETKETLGDFSLPDNLDRLLHQVDKTYLYYSQDDPVVPFADLDVIAAQLPSAEKITFSNYQHFRIKKFPELIDKIKNS